MSKAIRLIVAGEEGGIRVFSDTEAEDMPPKVERWIDVGDYVLVDPTAYFLLRKQDGERFGGKQLAWGKVTSIAPGTASRYPVKVEFQERDGFLPTGQFDTSEVVAIRHIATLGDQAESEYWSRI